MRNYLDTESATRKYTLTILIPTLNEEFAIARLLKEIKNSMIKTNIN